MAGAARERPPLSTHAGSVEDLLRDLAPQVLGALVRRYGQFDACEDAVQEALLAAVVQWPVQWPEQGVPDNPRGWLTQVASRRVVDEIRSDVARRRREERVTVLQGVPASDPIEDDDSLTLLFLCCHPALTAPTQIALTLRAVGGLSTAEIAAAFLVPEATMAQRISRAKQRIREAGATFEPPPAPERAGRLRAVLHVLYLVFNEGYTASSGPDLVRTDLTAEAIRLTRQLLRLVPDDGEVRGLLALLLLTEARHPARLSPAGELVPLDRQDRGLWNRALIAEGVELVSAALAGYELGPYQVQAAIAAVHDEAPSAAETDWLQVLMLHDVLLGLQPNPAAALNRCVAVAFVQSPEQALTELDALERVPVHRALAVRAHLEELAHRPGARAGYLLAARHARSQPEQRYLLARAAELTQS